MDTKATAASCTFSQPLKLEQTCAKTSLSNIFDDRKGCYLNELTLFSACFNAIPNLISEINIDCKKANPWFAAAYAHEIKDHYFLKRYFNESKKAELDDIFYFLYDDLIINFDTNCTTVRLLFKKTALETVETIIARMKKFKIKRRKPRYKPEITILIKSPFGMETKPLKINRPKLNLDYNYNDDFKEVHQTILKRLSKKDDKGLVLLHGKPGSGKTFYIRHLISKLRKKIVFLPPDMVRAITGPNLISILLENRDSIFIIEDAENVLIDRERNGISPASALLNISDGLLSDCLNIQLICSFNTDITKVDRALLRKGRLIAKYEFKELEPAKAQALSDKLGFTTIIEQPMTLTAIYNQEENDFMDAKKYNPIGFRAMVNN